MLSGSLNSHIARLLGNSPDVGGYVSHRDDIKEYLFGERVPVEVYPTIVIFTTGSVSRTPDLSFRADKPSQDVMIEAYVDVFISWDDHQELYFRLTRYTAAIRDAIKEDPAFTAASSVFRRPVMGSSIMNHMNSNLFSGGENLHQASRTLVRIWAMDETE